MLNLRTFRLTACLFLLLAAYRPSPARATPVWHVSVDTSSYQGTDGVLFLQFNPGGIASAATATVSNFQGGNILDPSSPHYVYTFDGAVTGALPGLVTLGNNDAFNDIEQGVRFGTSLSFDVTLSLTSGTVGGPAPSGYIPAGSNFSLSLFDSSGDILLTTDSNGSVVTLNLNTDGSVGPPQTFQTPSGGPPAASVTPAFSPTPEPGSLLLFATMLPAGIVLARRSRRQSHIRTAGPEGPSR